MSYLTTTAAAETLGCSRRTVQRLAADHNIGVVLGRDRLLTHADVRRLKSLVQPGPGRPRLEKSR